jgi:DNA-directed RNA polymerase subunit RPC12/RpoP
MNVDRKSSADRAGADDASVACPHCKTGRARQVSPFGMFLFTARYSCANCGVEFERVRHQSPADGPDRA